MKTIAKIFFLFFFGSRIFSADSTVVKHLFPGATLLEYYTSKPLALQELILNLDSINVGCALANNYLGNGGEKTSDVFHRIKKQNKKLFAAINADFFGGKPHRILNSMMMEGEIVKGINLNFSQFAIDKNGKPHIGIFPFKGVVFKNGFKLSIKYLNVKGHTPALFNKYYNRLFIKDSLKGGFLLQTIKPLKEGKTSPVVIRKEVEGFFLDTLKTNEIFLNVSQKQFDKISGSYTKGDTLFLTASFDSLNIPIKTLVGGRPALVKNGKAVKNFFGYEGLKSAWFIGKNPRTAIGYDKEGKKIFVVTVDGRQPGYSMGMTLPELAEFLAGQGAWFALNLDGGGSTTMVVNGKIVNSPSDSTGERPVHNALLFFRK